jgi:capsular exopolysaccharide synthesis family protein
MMLPLRVYGIIEHEGSSSLHPTDDQQDSPPRSLGRPRMPISLCAPDSAATEAYRTLRTWIQFSYQGDVLPTLLVTGPLSRKDTAMVTANLGVVLAQAGLKTVLIDADLRQPALQETGLCSPLKLSTNPGLSGLLVGSDDWPKYVVDTEISGLHLIPGGLAPSDPLGLLSSPRMTYLINQLERHFQVLLVHGPPILVASDALVLATQVNGTMMVIESGATTQKSATRAMARLQNAEVKVLGSILTRVRARSLKAGSYSDLSKPAQPPQLQMEAERSLSWLQDSETISLSQL